MDRAEFMARVRYLNSVSFTADGPELMDNDDLPAYTEDRVGVVQIQADMVRILENIDDSVVLLLWLPRDDLLPLLSRETRLADRTGKTPAGERLGVTVFAGTVIEPGQTQDGYTEISYDNTLYKFTGWLPTTRVGKIIPWTERQREPDAGIDVSFKRIALVTGGAAIYDQPGGKTIATISPSGPTFVHFRATDNESWLLMEYENIDFRVRGFVRTEKLSERIVSGFFRPPKRHGAWAVIETLPKDACLFDGINGQLIGRTLVGLSRRIVPDPQQGGYTTHFRTRWGKLKVFLEPDGPEMTSNGLPAAWRTCGPP